MSDLEQHKLEPNGLSGGPGSVLISTLTGGAVGFAVGKQVGYKKGFHDGYIQAKTESIAVYQSLDAHLQVAQRLSGEKEQQLGQLKTENEVLKSLLRQQPSNPQIEAVLKALQKIDFRLTQALPAAWDNPDPNTNN